MENLDYRMARLFTGNARAMENGMIGVFDSGVGGLTVLQALRKRLPQCDFLYVGDTARAPYGRKPAAMVAGYACEIADFLCERGVEAIVVACNTASAVALPELERRCSVPVWGVVDAGVEAATRATRSEHVGVIATQATIASEAYQRRLEARGLRVWARACPMLVHVVEEGLAEAPEADVLVRHYLSGMPEIDTLILGCTHYPLLRGAVRRAVGAGVRLVDSASVTAERVASEVEDRGAGGVTYYATGDTKAFGHTARMMGEAGHAVEALELSAAA
jgi:glutamate racemase